MSGFHAIDFAVIGVYLVVVIILGQRAARRAGNQEGFFLAGRKLGKLYQFFLNFGNSTDANSAVSTASLVYSQGVSGVWLGFQLIFLNPYYWFMNTWFRRVRLVTTADLFADRLGSSRLALFYALFQSLSAMVVVIGFGNLVTYKISSALMVKPESAWTSVERASVEGHRELQQLETRAIDGEIDVSSQERLSALREMDARGELRSYVTALSPLPFYVAYTTIVGIYIVMGGLAATAINEVLQSLIIVAFSIVLIPTGLAAVNGWAGLADRVPAAAFELVSTSLGAQQVTGTVLVSIVLVAVVQVAGLIGNMGISGSAKNEFAARFGAVAGTYAKRLIFILWAFAGLIAVGLFQGAEALADPDLVWGTLSRRLLGPGLLGLMLTGVLAANMSTVAAQTVSVSALFVRNVYLPLRPSLSEAGAVAAGRWSMVVVLGVGILAAMSMDSVISALLVMQTVSVPFGASIILMFFWRRLTVATTWIGLILAIFINVVSPLLVSRVPALRTHPDLVLRTEDEAGRPTPVFFDSVARIHPEDPGSPLEGRGRFHVELYLLDLAGLDMEEMAPSDRFAARFFFNVISPFALLIGLSLLTRPAARERIDQFYGKMKTTVGPTPELDAAAMEETLRDPRRFDHLKLFPRSSWEFTKWNRVDTIGFVVCCLLSGAIIGLFWLLLRLAAQVG